MHFSWLCQYVAWRIVITVKEKRTPPSSGLQYFVLNVGNHLPGHTESNSQDHNPILHQFNPLKAKLNPICHLLALLGLQFGDFMVPPVHSASTSKHAAQLVRLSENEQ